MHSNRNDGNYTDCISSNCYGNGTIMEMHVAVLLRKSCSFNGYLTVADTITANQN